jgi:hypothetical protein
MTTEEVIPVLLALRENPTTAPIFADWFEERGKSDVAELLRGWAFNNGRHVVAALAHGTTRNLRWFKPDPICYLSVIMEAMGRVELTTGDKWRLHEDLRYNSDVRNIFLGRQYWTRIPHDPSWDWSRSQRYTCVSPDGEKSQRVNMRLVKLKWEPEVVTLCGGWLELTMSVWVGVDPFTNRVIVTHFDKRLALAPRVKT